MRYSINGECRVLLVATRDISKGERLYYDYNGYEHEYPTHHFLWSFTSNSSSTESLDQLVFFLIAIYRSIRNCRAELYGLWRGYAFLIMKLVIEKLGFWIGITEIKMCQKCLWQDFCLISNEILTSFLCSWKKTSPP